ncbi:MAG TPA: hypothetical protein VF556_12110 [Pyrinomonadaceae bacterium]|jgi:hypothetical protein
MPTQLIRKQFLLTEDENKKLEAEAKSKGLSVSNLTRIKHSLEPLGAGGKREKTGRPPKDKKNSK